MEVMPHGRQYIGDESGLAYLLSVMHEDVPV
jgi:hypothetical protein